MLYHLSYLGAPEVYRRTGTSGKRAGVAAASGSSRASTGATPSPAVAIILGGPTRSHVQGGLQPLKNRPFGPRGAARRRATIRV
jgi:hypothetical protein